MCEQFLQPFDVLFSQGGGVEKGDSWTVVFVLLCVLRNVGIGGGGV